MQVYKTCNLSQRNVSILGYMSTRPDMWHGKPEREDRTTSYQTLDMAPRKTGVPIWIKVVVIVALMFGFLLALKSIIGW